MGAGTAPMSILAVTWCPTCSKAGKPLMAYSFDGYWIDVGTVQAYWEANMALLAESRPWTCTTRIG